VFCLRQFLYKKINFEKKELKSAGPIFTKFSPYGRCLIVNFRFDPLFSDRSRDVAMATNLRVKIDKIGLLSGPLSVALAFRNGLNIAILILKCPSVMI